MRSFTFAIGALLALSILREALTELPPAYILHPNGSGIDGGEVIGDALVMTMRLEMSF